MSKQREIINILKGVTSGNVAPAEALNLWPDSNSKDNPVLKRAWHDLYHFSVDVDIQEKDPEYREYQLNLIKSDIELIENSMD